MSWKRLEYAVMIQLMSPPSTMAPWTAVAPKANSSCPKSALTPSRCPARRASPTPAGNARRSERNQCPPHFVKGVAVVHNGIIENFSELRDELTAEGAVFETQTDTPEVVAHLVAKYLGEGLDARGDDEDAEPCHRRLRAGRHAAKGPRHDNGGAPSPAARRRLR